MLSKRPGLDLLNNSMESIFLHPRNDSDELVKSFVANKLEQKYGEVDKERVVKVLELCGKKIVSAIKKDLNNRYSLTEDWLLPPVKFDLPEYDDEFISIAPLGNGTSLIMVYAYQSDAQHNYCDGASMFPDKVKGVLPASLFHDMWYLRMEAIAKAWGWKVSKVRKLGDQILASIMIEENANTVVVNFCYYCSRLFGGIFHSIMKIKWLKKILTCVIFVAILCVSFSGCIHSVFVDEPDIPYVPPNWCGVKCNSVSC